MFSTLCGRLACTNRFKNPSLTALDQPVAMDKNGKIPSKIEFETVTVDIVGSTTYVDENYIVDPSIIQFEKGKPILKKPGLKEIACKVIARRDGSTKKDSILTVSNMIRLWEEMQNIDDFIEENDVDSVTELVVVMEDNVLLYNALDAKDNEDIKQLSTLFNADGDDTRKLLNESKVLEDQVIDELSTRIEERFVLKQATQLSEQNLEKSCKMIHDVIKKNPRSSITKKDEFKNIAKRVAVEAKRNSLKEDVSKHKSFAINDVVVERRGIVKEDNYSAFKNIWEKGCVAGESDSEEIAVAGITC